MHHPSPKNEYDQWYGEQLPATRTGGTLTPLRHKVAAVFNRLPRPTDPRQKQSFSNLLRFFALIIVLTLVARGTSGATVAKVTTQRPHSADIIKRVQGTGTVTAAGSHLVKSPFGLVVKELSAKTGEKVEAGQPLARFDAEEVEKELKRQQAALQELEFKLTQLRRGQSHDGSALQTAQRGSDRARQDYDAEAAATSSAVSSAQNALSQAEAAAAQAHSDMEAIEDKQSPEYTEAQSVWQQKTAAVETSRGALSAAQSDANSRMQAATRGLEDAQAALDAARRADEKARQEAGDTTAQNRIQSSTVELDIVDKKQLIEQLQSIKDADSSLLADAPGTVMEAPAAGTKTSETSPFKLSSTQGGYTAEVWLDKKNAAKLAPGNTCEVSASDGGFYYHAVQKGTLVSLGEAGEDGRVKAVVRLLEGDWKTGQTVSVQVVQEKQNHPLCLPLSALHSASDSYYVLQLQEKSTVMGTEYVAVKVPVTVRSQDNAMAAVEGSLNTGDDIIVSSNKAVNPGDKVRTAQS